MGSDVLMQLPRRPIHYISSTAYPDLDRIGKTVGRGPWPRQLQHTGPSIYVSLPSTGGARRKERLEVIYSGSPRASTLSVIWGGE